MGSQSLFWPLIATITMRKSSTVKRLHRTKKVLKWLKRYIIYLSIVVNHNSSRNAEKQKGGIWLSKLTLNSPKGNVFLCRALKEEFPSCLEMVSISTFQSFRDMKSSMKRKASFFKHEHGLLALNDSLRPRGLFLFVSEGLLQLRVEIFHAIFLPVKPRKVTHQDQGNFKTLQPD